MTRTCFYFVLLSTIILSIGKSTVAFNFQVEREVFNGKVLRVVVLNHPPMLTLKKLDYGNYSHEGIISEVMEWVKQYFNLKFEFVYMNPKEVTQYGFEPALLRQLAMGTVDLMPFVIETSLKNLEVMAYMQPLSIQDTHFLQPFPSTESRISTPIKPFTTEVWLYFLGSMASLIAVLSLFAVIGHHDEKNNFLHRGYKTSSHSTYEDVPKIHYLTLWHVVMLQIEYILTSITSQGNSIRYSSRIFVQIAISAWLLATVVLVYAYTGVFTSIMAAPKFEPTVNSFEELAKSPRFRLTIDKQTQQSRQILEATSGPYKIVGDSLRQNPELLFGDFFQMTENILRRDCVYPTITLFSRYIILEDKKASGMCRMTAPTKLLPKTVALQIGLAKGNPDAKLLDHLALQWIASGMVVYLLNKYYPTTPQCLVYSNLPNHQQPIPIKLNDLGGVFVLLFVGYSVSVLVFIIEKLM